MWKDLRPTARFWIAIDHRAWPGGVVHLRVQWTDGRGVVDPRRQVGPHPAGSLLVSMDAFIEAVRPAVRLQPQGHFVSTGLSDAPAAASSGSGGPGQRDA